MPMALQFENKVCCHVILEITMLLLVSYNDTYAHFLVAQRSAVPEHSNGQSLLAVQVWLQKVVQKISERTIIEILNICCDLDLG